MTRRRPKTAPDGPDRSKTAPRRPQVTLQSPKIHPRRLQTGPGRPKLLKIIFVFNVSLRFVVIAPRRLPKSSRVLLVPSWGALGALHAQQENTENQKAKWKLHNTVTEHRNKTHRNRNRITCALKMAPETNPSTNPSVLGRFAAKNYVFLGSPRGRLKDPFKRAPKRTQDEPKTAQDGPKTSPRRPKTAPRRPQDGPKTAPSRLQVAFKCNAMLA